MENETPNIEPNNKEFTPNAFIIPGDVMLDPKLQPLDTKVYGIIYWLEHLRDGACTASNATIAKMLSVHPRSVQRSIANLSEHQYIYVVSEWDYERDSIITAVKFNKMEKEYFDKKSRGDQMDVGVRPNGRGGGDQMDTQINNNKISNNKGSKENIEKKNALVNVVYYHYLSRMVVDYGLYTALDPDKRRELLSKASKKYSLTPKRRAKILTRLKEFEVKDLLAAIDNISQSDWHNGNGNNNWKAELEWIMGSTEKVEKWANKEDQ